MAEIDAGSHSIKLPRPLNGLRMIITATDAIDLLSTRLASEQFANGFCGYTTPQFATEPTCFASLALRDKVEKTITSDSFVRS